MNSRFAFLDSRIEKMASKLDEVLSSMHRTQALVEEQHSDNRIVREARIGLAGRQDRVEADVNEMKNTMATLAKTKRSPAKGTA